MNANLPLHFLLLLEKSTNGLFSACSNPTEGIKLRFQWSDCMIYRSIQNVLFDKIKRRKMKFDANPIVPFLQWWSGYEKLESGVITKIKI